MESILSLSLWDLATLWWRLHHRKLDFYRKSRQPFFPWNVAKLQWHHFVWYCSHTAQLPPHKCLLPNPTLLISFCPQWLGKPKHTHSTSSLLALWYWTQCRLRWLGLLHRLGVFIFWFTSIWLLIKMTACLHGDKDTHRMDWVCLRFLQLTTLNCTLLLSLFNLYLIFLLFFYLHFLQLDLYLFLSFRLFNFVLIASRNCRWCVSRGWR